MSLDNCDVRIRAYTEELNSYVGPNDPLPAAIFFSQPNCNGTRFPFNVHTGYPETGGFTHELLFAPQSLFVPKNVSVTLLNTTLNSTYHLPLEKDGTSSVLLKNVEGLTFPNGQALKGNIGYYEMHYRPTYPYVDSNTFRLAMCEGYIMPLRLSIFERYDPYENTTCDVLMATLCAEGASRRNDKICACYKERDELAVKYANEEFPEYPLGLPVTCMGKKCAQYGYRDEAMRLEQCDLTICQNIVQLYGNNIAVSQKDSIIICGNQQYDVNEEKNKVSVPVEVTPTFVPLDPVPEDPTEAPSPPLPIWVFVLIAVAVLGFFIGIGFVIRARVQKK